MSGSITIEVSGVQSVQFTLGEGGVMYQMILIGLGLWVLVGFVVGLGTVGFCGGIGWAGFNGLKLDGLTYTCGSLRILGEPISLFATVSVSRV